jgi:indolepyruvate ferredoxin oxidoreductase
LQSIAAIVRATPGSQLDHLVRVRVRELQAYQDRGYARRYATWVEKIRAREAEVVSGEALAEAVAANLFKLMAYKDEYEVSRLHLDAHETEKIRGQFGSDARVRIMLHPPVLKAMGVQRKIGVPSGPAGTAMFRVLSSMKRLRNTRLDPFGRDHVRVVERELIAEYEGLLGEILASVNPYNHDVAVRLAGLPDLVRGYDEVKLANVEAYRQQVAQLRAQLSEPAPVGQQA